MQITRFTSGKGHAHAASFPFIADAEDCLNQSFPLFGVF